MSPVGAISGPIDMQRMGKLNVRRALTPPANPRERADLCATSPADRCLTSRLDVMRADDPL
jgi:hypothetical protein